MPCIYTILNIKNNKCYIGSAKNFKKRKTRHLRDLRRNKHHCIYLQRAWNKYGSDNFIFKILEECDEKNLFKLEKFWINKLNPEYNIGAVGGGDNFTNHPNKKEIYKKIVKALLSAPRPKPLYGENNPNYKDGRTIKKHYCKCGLEKSFESKKCKKCNDKNRYGKKNPFYGKKHSDKTKEKIKKANSGRKPPNTQQCIINGKKFKSLSDAAKYIGCTTATIKNRINSKKFEDYKLIEVAV